MSEDEFWVLIQLSRGNTDGKVDLRKQTIDLIERLNELPEDSLLDFNSLFSSNCGKPTTGTCGPSLTSHTLDALMVISKSSAVGLSVVGRTTLNNALCQPSLPLVWLLITFQPKQSVKRRRNSMSRRKEFLRRGLVFPSMTD